MAKRINHELIENEPTHETPVDEHDYAPSDIDLSFSDRFNVRNIYHPKSNHSVERKIEAVSAYVVTGSSLKAAKACKIPAPTIRQWKNTSCWWEDAYQAAKLQLDSQLEAGLYKGLKEGMDILHRQMLTGKDVEVGTEEYTEIDEVTGRERKMKMKIFAKQEIPFKEMTIGWSILWDKLQLAQGRPTSRTEKIESPQQIMNQLRDELSKISQEMIKDKQLNSITPDKDIE